MCEISFGFMKKDAFGEYAPQLFAILHRNMSRIAPTGNRYEEDFALWREGFGSAFAGDTARKIVLILSQGGVIGFFAYSVRGDTFRMEEIEFAPEFQGRHHLFRRLYGFVIENLPTELQFVEAYANKKNEKSLAVLKHLGLKIVGENKNGFSHHLRGSFGDLLAWLRGAE